MTFEDRMKELAAAVAEFAAEVERDVFWEHPAEASYDLECCAKETIAAIKAFREEAAEREAAAKGVSDKYAEFRHRKHELV